MIDLPGIASRRRLEQQDLSPTHRHRLVLNGTRNDEELAGSKRDDLVARMSAVELAEAEQMASTWLENYQTLHANQ